MGGHHEIRFRFPAKFQDHGVGLVGAGVRLPVIMLLMLALSIKPFHLDKVGFKCPWTVFKTLELF
jgi:hypothetical protein